MSTTGVAIKEDGTCIRCTSRFGKGDRCQYCGVGHDRIVRYKRRRNKSTGKRGRNSGTTKTSKNKK